MKIPKINIKLPIPANNTLWLQTFLDTSDSSRKSIQYPKMSNLYTTGSIQVFQAPCPQPVSAQHHHALAWLPPFNLPTASFTTPPTTTSRGKKLWRKRTEAAAHCTMRRATGRSRSTLSSAHSSLPPASLSTASCASFRFARFYLQYFLLLLNFSRLAVLLVERRQRRVRPDCQTRARIVTDCDRIVTDRETQGRIVTDCDRIVTDCQTRARLVTDL